jgi:hypothetical protein
LFVSPQLILFFLFIPLPQVCSAQSVFGDESPKLNNDGLEFVKEVASTLSDLQQYLAQNGDARQALDDDSLSAIRDNIQMLTEKLQDSNALNFLNQGGRGSRSEKSIFDLKENLETLTSDLLSKN